MLALGAALAGCATPKPPPPPPPHGPLQPERPPPPPPPPATVPDERPADCPPEDLGRAERTQDGALLLTGAQVVVLGRGPYEFSRICVQDQAVIRFCGSTVIHLTGEQPTVIGGGGIGPLGSRRGSLRLEAPDRPPLWVLVENKTAPVDLYVDSPQGNLTVAITGKTGLNISGSPLNQVTHNAGWGDTHNFPPRCGAPAPPPPPPPPPLPEPVAQESRAFTASEEPQSFRVPAGVHRLMVEAWGAGGGGGSGGKANAQGGGGGFARATIQVSPGEELQISVGEGGAGTGLPGFGTTAGGGGGASFVSRANTTLLVAGGGGGAGADGCGGCEEGLAGGGGAGGAEVGERGQDVVCYREEGDRATGGAGGTQSSGGAGGAGPSGRGEPGAAFKGGASRGWTGIA
ncbi:MAG TPA: hypothetical protein VND93_32710, partial [Myxococcales bacterium]|nr:hypothetical protein [Myxococcales bacterium]